jgi:hypothetical protein
MIRAGRLIRLLMLVVCLLPFGNTRQAAAAIAPLAPVGSPAPAQGQEEEDDSEREPQAAGKAKQRVTHHRVGQEADPPTLIDRLPPVTSVARPDPIPAVPADPDPFRNGLGTHYRC